jgi:hypothetical protein
MCIMYSPLPRLFPPLSHVYPSVKDPSARPTPAQVMTSPLVAKTRREKAARMEREREVEESCVCVSMMQLRREFDATQRAPPRFIVFLSECVGVIVCACQCVSFTLPPFVEFFS